MSLVFRDSGKGVYVAEQSYDEQAMQRALTAMDDRLVLSKEVDPLHQCWRYKVVRVWSDEHPAGHIIDWSDDYGNPLPLSSGLLDAVQERRPENRHKRVDADEHNAALVARRRRESDEEIDGISHENRKKLWRAPLDPHDVGGAYTLARITPRFGQK